MCFPSCKSIFICCCLAGLVSLILVTIGPRAFVVPAETIKQYLPTPHISIRISRGSPYDIGLSFTDAGYEVERGQLVSLSQGTCEQCMGSPALGNPHLAVSFEDKEGVVPECFYNNTNLSPAFHLNYDEALIIFADGPNPDVFEEFSWGTYIFDTWDTRGRALIQAAVSLPLRPRKDSRMMIVLSFMPEITEILSQTLEDVDVHGVVLSTKLIQTDLAPLYNDRIAVILKTIAKDNPKALEFYEDFITNTEILKIRIRDPSLRGLVRQGQTYKEYNLGFAYGEEKTELQSLAPTMEKVVDSVKSNQRVSSVMSMLPLREVLGVKEPADCVTNKINCLAEDWDVSYSVSGGIILPDSGQYSAVIIGVDHPEGRRTTVSLYNVNTNQELMEVPLEEDLIYVHWISRDCEKEFEPCTQINFAEEFFIRERSYGVETYEKLIPPKILLIKH